MKQLFLDIILENQEIELPKINPRDIEVPINVEIIISLIGSRRSGKTYILYQLMQKLFESGISKQNIIFINFEDERLNIQQKDLDNILQAYQEYYPNIKLKDVYFFFDEIQNIKGWEKFVRRVFDTKSKKLFITGSNSKLLSSEIATELKGRTLSFTVFPYNFNEFLHAKLAPKSIKTQAQKSKILNLTKQYLFEGSFPELIDLPKGIKNKILQQYFNIMIYRDIVEHYKITSPEVLKYFIKKVFTSVTSPLSINKIYNDIKSMGYKISNKYLYKYANICKSIFMTQEINRFSYSEIKQIKSNKKVYIIDTGLLNAIDFRISKNKGKLFENLVVMEFLKEGKELFYYKDKYECDLILKENNTYKAIQISFSIKNSETKKCELRGLHLACSLLGKKEGIVLTFDEEGEELYRDIKVKIIPFYKYFGIFN